jgi:two-component system NtrC family sensor kinase
MQALLSRSRPNVIWPLRVIAAACLIGPLLLFAYSGLTSYRGINQQASERLERALDVLQEHAHKALQTIERSIAETNEVLRGLSDEESGRTSCEYPNV